MIDVFVLGPFEDKERGIFHTPSPIAQRLTTVTQNIWTQLMREQMTPRELPSLLSVSHGLSSESSLKNAALSSSIISHLRANEVQNGCEG